MMTSDSKVSQKSISPKRDILHINQKKIHYWKFTTLVFELGGLE